MPRILGIDSSLTSTGLCLITVHPWPPSHPFRGAGEPVNFTAQLATIKSKPDKAKTWRTTSARITKIVDQVAAAMDDDIALVVMEGRSYASKGTAAIELDWLWGRIVDATVRANVPLIVATPSQRCRYATGKGNADKDTVLAASIHRFPTIPIAGNDTADATIMAAIGCRSLDLPIDMMPKLHYEQVMTALAA